MSINKNKWKRKEIIMFLEKIEMYISSGLSIDKAFLIIEEDFVGKKKTDVLLLRKHLESGNTLSSGLLEKIHISKTVFGLIEYGESSGALAESLVVAKKLLEKEDELRRKCLGAMIYPLVIGIFAISLTIGLIKGIMSQIIPMLKSLKVELPLVTKITIFFSEIIIKHGLSIFLSVLFLFFLLKFFYKKRQFKSIIHNFLIHIPILGKIIYNYNLSIFLHSCGSLVSSGLFVRDAYVRTINTVGLIPLHGFLQERADLISRGVSLGSVFRGKMIPRYINSLLGAGEISGNLGLSILRSGNILDKDIDENLKRLTSLIEPIMMIVIGCVVGTIALSIMLPIYNISGALQR